MTLNLDQRPAVPTLLAYRPWRGQFHGPTAGMWAIARTALHLLLRRRLFWGLYALCVMIFLFFFYGQYLQSWIGTQLGDKPLPVGGIILPFTGPELRDALRNALQLDGSGYTYGNFIWFEGYIVTIVLALAGSILVGNDFHFRSLPFYLSKPLHRWHYLGGKFLAVAVFTNLITTVPAIVLYIQYGLIDSWSYYYTGAKLLLGIVGYGALLTTCLGLLLLASACWLRRTVPVVMVWTALFVFGRLMSALLVDGLQLNARWRLVDLWNNMYLVGNWCLRIPSTSIRPLPQPPAWEAGLVLSAVCLACVAYLNRQIQAVEIVP